MTRKEVAELLSEANFEQVADQLADNIEWNMYEDSNFLKGKLAVIGFSKEVRGYFQSVTTEFETLGVIEDENKIAIYGRAEFIRDGKRVNAVNSCDVYEFDENGNVSVVNSYCNSKRSDK